MHRKTIDVPAPRVLLVGLHDRFRPFGPPGFSATGADGDLQHLLFVLLCRIEVADKAAVDLELAEIVVGVMLQPQSQLSLPMPSMATL